MSEFALDASALLALLNNEASAAIVQECLPKAVISAVNLAEVSARLTALRMPAEEVRQVIRLLGLEVVPFDDETALQSGFLYRATHSYGLSLGDRSCLALAKQKNLTAVTADRAWAQLDIGVAVQVIRS